MAKKLNFYVRYAHLERASNLNIGDIAKQGTIIGVMGNTGASLGAHLHFDIVNKRLKRLHRLSDIHSLITDYKALALQYAYFIDETLFGVKPYITSYFSDPLYYINNVWKDHPAYDIVPENANETKDNWAIRWNRSLSGKVVDKGYDENGYGHYVIIHYVQ